jgi:hypothetical protein
MAASADAKAIVSAIEDNTRAVKSLAAAMEKVAKHPAVVQVINQGSLDPKDVYKQTKDLLAEADDQLKQ